MARILIVEDEEKIARFVTLELEHEGYQVEHAADGRTAVDLALERDYDLILLDVLLPQLNGMEVLRTKPDPRPIDKRLDLREIRVGRAHDDINVRGDKPLQPIDQGSILTLPTVHLPVANDKLFPHA